MLPGPIAPEAVPFREALRVWLRVALQSFGGPAGQIAVMHRILVEEKKWVSEERFLHALNFCMLLPGPEAQQLATYIGWLLHGAGGGIVAGAFFVLPGFLAILALSFLYVEFHDTHLLAALFFGLKPAVAAVVIEAVLRIGRRALKNALLWALAAGAFIAIFFFAVPFPWIIVTAGLVGLAGGRWWPALFPAPGHGAAAHSGGEPVADRLAAMVKPSWGRSLRVIAVWGGLWLLPVAALILLRGRGDALVEQGIFFSQTAVVTFGGAYAVLSYVAQRAVEGFGWLTPQEMLDGLGMAETTPGPLIQVVQFVGFLGAYRNPGGLDPWLAGLFGSLITTWVTYMPCFLWIFLGAPSIERLRTHCALGSALAATTATVVGVILNLALWFSLHTLFGRVEERRLGVLRLQVPDVTTLDAGALLIALGAAVAIFRFKVGMLKALAASALAGVAWWFLLRG